MLLCSGPSPVWCQASVILTHSSELDRNQQKSLGLCCSTFLIVRCDKKCNDAFYSGSSNCLIPWNFNVNTLRGIRVVTIHSTWPNHCNNFYSNSVTSKRNSNSCIKIVFLTLSVISLLIFSFPGVKQQRREAEHSTPSSDEVNNGGATRPLPHTSSWHGA
jgi:hypothetical protein